LIFDIRCTYLLYRRSEIFIEILAILLLIDLLALRLYVVNNWHSISSQTFSVR
jgi:hypothetical protein